MPGLNGLRICRDLVEGLLSTEFPERVAEVAGEWGVEAAEGIIATFRYSRPYNLIQGLTAIVPIPRGRPVTDPKKQTSPLHMTTVWTQDVALSDIGGDREALAAAMELRLEALCRTFSFGNTPNVYLYRLVDIDGNPPSPNSTANSFGMHCGVRVEITTIETL